MRRHSGEPFILLVSRQAGGPFCQLRHSGTRSILQRLVDRPAKLHGFATRPRPELHEPRLAWPLDGNPKGAEPFATRPHLGRENMRCCTIQNTARTIACAILLGFAGAASADEIPEPKSVAGELLEILRAAGTINDSQYRDLSERAREEEALRIETAVTAAVAGANQAVDEAVETAALASTKLRTELRARSQRLEIQVERRFQAQSQ